MNASVGNRGCVQRFKKGGDAMDDRAYSYYMQHKKAFEHWPFGEPEKCWLDKDGVFCISYESGVWWHYRENKGILEWW